MVQEKRKYWLQGGILLLTTLIAYAPAILYGGFIWDDNAYVTENGNLRSLHGLWRIWFQPGATNDYYPLTYSAFWIQFHLWKLNPIGYHLVNVILHFLNALLVRRVLLKLEVPGAWMAALIFAVHPVHVESVAWITELKNLLSGMFYLLASLAFIRFARIGAATEEDGRRKDYFLSLFYFSLALLSKPVTCTLPAALLVLIWWKRGSITQQHVKWLSPMFLIGLAIGLFTSWIQKHHLGTQGEAWELSLIDRCLIAGRALWFYLWKLFLPVNLTFSYPRWNIDAAQWWQYLFPCGMLLVLVLLWRFRGKLGRGPLAGILYFILTLSPALGFMDFFTMIYSFVADHYQYLASLGIIALFSAFFSTRFDGSHVRLTGFNAIVFSLAILAFMQCLVYRDLESLWRDTIRKNSQSWMAQNNLGATLQRKGRYPESLQHFSNSLSIKPDHFTALENLTRALISMRHYEEAEDSARRLIQMDPRNASGWVLMGDIHMRRGQNEAAIGYFNEALKLDPNSSEVHLGLGTLLLQEDQLTEARSHLLQSLHSSEKTRLITPNPEAHYNLAVCLSRMGRDAEAIGHFEKALLERPDDPDFHFGMAVSLLEVGREQDAIRHLQDAVRINPGDQEAREILTRLSEGREKPGSIFEESQ